MEHFFVSEFAREGEERWPIDHLFPDRNHLFGVLVFMH